MLASLAGDVESLASKSLILVPKGSGGSSLKHSRGSWRMINSRDFSAAQSVSSFAR
jgi:hypothetical protein